MFKKVLSTTVLTVSVLGAMAANAAVPGVYVTGQVGYANTHMNINTDIINHDLDIQDSDIKARNLSNNGLAGRIALGYQFNQNFAIEAGYLHLGESKADLGVIPHESRPHQGTLKLRQNVIDFAGKGILPVSNNINVYGKLGVAYVTTDIKATYQTPGQPTDTTDLNDTANVAKHKWAPEATVGVSYGITPNVSVDTSWTHIQPLGNDKPGNIDFVAVGLSYNFG